MAMLLHPLCCCCAGNERLGDFTPAFLWLLRDFYLRLEEEGRKVGPTQPGNLHSSTSAHLHNTGRRHSVQDPSVCCHSSSSPSSVPYQLNRVYRSLCCRISHV